MCEDLERYAKIIEALAINLHRVTVGSSASLGAEMYADITHPRVGDLVLEISARRKPVLTRLGYLTAIQIGIVEDEWDEKLDGPRPQEVYWCIHALDGKDHRWFNCMFIRVLTEIAR